MPSFDDLYVRNILLLSRDTRGTCSLGSPAALPFYVDDKDMIALMATTTRIQRQQEREHRRAAPLLEVLYNLQVGLKRLKVTLESPEE
jgi:hypothetical protein